MTHPDPANLTGRQLEVLATIYRLTAAGCPPTFRDLMRQAGDPCANGVFSHLDALEKKGWLHYVGDGPGYKRSRAIRLRGLEMRPTFTEDADGEALRRAIGAATLANVTEGV